MSGAKCSAPFTGPRSPTREGTEDATHMTRLAESVTGMCRLEPSTNLRRVLRDRTGSNSEPPGVTCPS